MQTKTIYIVSADGTIVHAEVQSCDDVAQWQPIAALQVFYPELIGRDLFSFIAGREVRHLYGLLHERVLRNACDIRFQYRCDSPEIRRDMSMSLKLEDDLVRYESVLLKETPRTVPLPAPTEGAELLVPICSVCKRFRFPLNSKNWKEIELIVAEPDFPQQFDFTHTFCEICYVQLLGELAA